MPSSSLSLSLDKRQILENVFKWVKLRVSQYWTPLGLGAFFQSCHAGSPLDFYKRNVLHMLVRFHPCISFFVHALLGIPHWILFASILDGCNEGFLQ